LIDCEEWPQSAAIPSKKLWIEGHFEGAKRRMGRMVGTSRMRGTDWRSKRAVKLRSATARMPIVTKDCRGPLRRDLSLSEGLMSAATMPAMVQINGATWG